MSAPIPSLEGRHGWLTTPSTAAVAAGVGVAAAYLWFALDLPLGTRGTLFTLLGVVAVVFKFLGGAVEQRQLLPLRELAEGVVAPTRANLARAARSVLRGPDVTFFVVLGLVAGGAVLVSLGWWALASVPAAVALRLGFIGVVIAPSTAVLANLMVLPRERAVLRLLLELGLRGEDVRQVGEGRFELGRRLLVFAAVSVLSPLVMITDLSLSRTHRLLEKLAAVAPEAQAQVAAAADRDTGLVPLLVLGGLVLLLVIANAWLSGSALGAPLAELAQSTERLARGDFAQPMRVAAEFETWDAAQALGLLQAQLVTASLGLEASALGITGATAELVAGAQRHRKGADEQTQTLAATTATTEELARSAQQIAANAQTVSELAKSALASSRTGEQNATSFTASMGQIRAGNQGIADAVVRLNKRVQQVGRIVVFIDGIADRSDLLALNAELEGTKAGEVGRGFSLVAAEMRRLAESVMTSTREISRLLEEIRDATNAAVMATEAGVKASDKSASLAQAAADGLHRIVEFANQTSSAMESVTAATLQQQSGTDQLVKAMASILHSTRTSVDASGQMVTANEQLSALASELETSVRQLKGGG